MKTPESIQGYWLYQDGEFKNILYFGNEKGSDRRYKGYESWEDSCGPMGKEEFTYEYDHWNNELYRWYGVGPNTRYKAILSGTKLTLSSPYEDVPVPPKTYKYFHPKKK